MDILPQAAFAAVSAVSALSLLRDSIGAVEAAEHDNVMAATTTPCPRCESARTTTPSGTLGMDAVTLQNAGCGGLVVSLSIRRLTGLHGRDIGACGKQNIYSFYI
jgi:hypothetical protein